MTGQLTWGDDGRLAVDGIHFRVLPDEYSAGSTLDIGDAEFLVAKPRAMIDRYVDLIGELQPSNIVELGVLQGGSTVLFAKLARPRRLVAVDALPLNHLAKVLAEHPDVADVVRTCGKVDQADRPRLRETVEQELAGEPLDLVVDDCSHLYEPTRASFNELFPRLRPGGVYVIEDWAWAHTPLGVDPLVGLYPDQTPLSRIVLELVLALPSIPGLIEEIRLHVGAVEVQRGDAEVDPADFDVAASANARGLAMINR